MRTCPRCKVELPLSCFGRDRKYPNGHAYYCKPCARDKTAAWRAANPDKVRAMAKRRYANHPDPEKRKKDLARWKALHPERTRDMVRKCNLKRNYGITVEQYTAKLLEQGGVCRICRMTDPGKWLEVDHDHTTGAVRGLLCHGCNAGLGNFKDNPVRLNAAIQYLKEQLQTTALTLVEEVA